MPTMEADLAPYREDGSVEVVRTNLEGAKYTLAVSKSLADEGLRDFADIAASPTRSTARSTASSPAMTATG
jgi:glycine betaine/proline transport system substrate-binding protein